MQFITDVPDDFAHGCGLTTAQVKVLVSRFKNLKDLENRPIYIEPKPGTQMPNNAVVVSTNYPFGWHGRYVRILFCEWRDKHGYRVVTATSNKTFTGFNTPKAGTYTIGVACYEWDVENHPFINVLYLNAYDAADEAKKDFIGKSQNRQKYAKFFADYSEFMCERDKEFMQYYLRLMDNATEKLKHSNKF